MSMVIATPELITAAATDLQSIGTTLNAAHITAAAPTFAVPPAAADEVSASIAQLFSGYGQEYQKLAGKAAAFHDQFVQHLNASADIYGSAEAVNIGLLQPLTSIADSFLAASGVQESLRDLLMSYQHQLLIAFFDSQFGYAIYTLSVISIIVAFFALFFALGMITILANSIGAGEVLINFFSAIGSTASALTAIA